MEIFRRIKRRERQGCLGGLGSLKGLGGRNSQVSCFTRLSDLIDLPDILDLPDSQPFQTIPNHMKKLLLLPLFLLLLSVGASAQTTPTRIAVFPFKNLTGEVIYDGLSWSYTDSLVKYLNTKTELAGTVFELVPVDEVRDQMLALNIDVKSPAYETQVWELAKLLGATKVVWGTYFVKYDKANLEAKVVDVKTMLPDGTNFADKIKIIYAQALETIPRLGDKILPG